MISYSVHTFESTGATRHTLQSLWASVLPLVYHAILLSTKGPQAD